jgi:hypothetical protein
MRVVDRVRVYAQSPDQASNSVSREQEDIEEEDSENQEGSSFSSEPIQYYYANGSSKSDVAGNYTQD